jgi:endoglucanase
MKVVEKQHQVNAEILDRVGFSQVGFAAQGPKILVVQDAGATSFCVYSSLGCVVCNGELGEAKCWEADTGASRALDFSCVTQAGEYVIEIPSYGIRLPVRVEQAPWVDLSVALLKGFYFQRASMELKEEHAGAFARQAGHPDSSVLIHASAASESRPEGTVISAPKGWYDAGDYNKYMVNSGISVWTLLSIYENFPAYAKTLALNIPESRGPLPDLLAEVKWNLDWMQCMQDPLDGGVYHKLTNLRFDAMVMPEECKNARYAVMKSTAASFHFAATMAQASRIYQPFDAVFATQCIQMARQAFVWGMENPQRPYRQPEDVRTGRYDDEQLEDELQWAAFELFISTGEEEFERIARSAQTGDYGIPVWQRVGSLGLISMALRRNDLWSRNILLGLADQLLERQSRNAYRVSMTMEDFVWGSNGMAANQGVVLLVAYQLTNKVAYLEASVHMMDYLVGCNPLRMCFITGQGLQSPLHPHHRISEADAVIAPVPGLLVGGPNPGRQDARNCPEYPSSAPALAYQDHLFSYASNEIAINWSAPVAYLAAGLSTYYLGNKSIGS